MYSSAEIHVWWLLHSILPTKIAKSRNIPLNNSIITGTIADIISLTIILDLLI
jgi:hypothetical protein